MASPGPSDSGIAGPDGPFLAPPAGALECAILPSQICDKADAPAANASNTVDVTSTGIFALLTWVLRILTAAVGIAAIGTIIYAGILYSSAGGDSGMVTKAKTLIRDTVIGIVAYGLMFVLLNFIIPGGVFTT